MFIRLHVKYRYWIFPTDFEKYWSIKFH